MLTVKWSFVRFALTLGAVLAMSFIGGAVAKAQGVGGYAIGRDYYSPAEFMWQAGQEPVKMMTTYEGFCFITGIVGKFDSATDRVRVYVVDEEWLLGGAASSETIAVAARCIRLNEVLNEP